MITEGLLLNVLCGIGFASLGAILSFVTQKEINVFGYYFIGSILAFCGGAIFQMDWSLITSVERISELLFWMLCGAILNCLGHLLLYYNMRNFHKGASWAVAMSALLIPYCGSVFLWGEKLTFAGTIGIVVILSGIGGLAVARRDSSNGQLNIIWFISAISNFACYGGAQLCMGVPSHWSGWHDAANLRSTISALFCAVFMLGVILVRKERIEKITIPYAAAYSIVYLGTLILIYRTLDILTPVGLSKIFWPLGAGVCIVSFCIFSHLRFKEKFSRIDIIGITGIILGLLFIAEIVS